MNALKLLTAQHDELAALIEALTAAGDEVGRRGLLDELADKLVVHLAIEQELLYPAIAGLVSPGVRDELQAEHAELRRVLGDLWWYDAGDPLFERALARLAALLDGHARWQTEELFATVADSLTPDALAALGARLRTCHDSPNSLGAVAELSHAAA